jgi:hypothetical protein
MIQTTSSSSSRARSFRRSIGGRNYYSDARPALCVHTDITYNCTQYNTLLRGVEASIVRLLVSVRVHVPVYHTIVLSRRAVSPVHCTRYKPRNTARCFSSAHSTHSMHIHYLRGVEAASSYRCLYSTRTGISVPPNAVARMPE